MRFIAILLFGLLQALPLRAQEDAPAPLVVPFFSVPPFLQYDADGGKSGFSVALAEELGEELGLSIEYLEVQSSRAFVDVQASGEAQLLPGVAKLPPLLATNVFSDVIAHDPLRVAVLEERAAEFGEGDLIGFRVGIVPPAVGSELQALLARNDVVEFETVEAAVMGLLIGSVDALLSPNPVTFNVAKQARNDARIRFVGAPVREVDRVIALHESRAELMPAINAALARMEADGRLEALRLRYNVTVPASPPDVLTVGVAHTPPNIIINDDGSYSGFNVEVMRGLAERIDAEIAFQTLPLQSWLGGPVASGTDLILGLANTPERAVSMDFSYSIREWTISLLTTAQNRGKFDDPRALEGRRIGAVSKSILETVARSAGAEDLGLYSEEIEMLDALLAGEVEGFLLPTQNAARLLGQRADTESVVVLPQEVRTINVSIALRPGLGAVRERLNAVIPGYLLSNEYGALQQKYFGAPEFWTRARVIWALIAAGAATLLVGGIFAGASLRQRERTAQKTALMRDELDTIFNAATSGIVAFGADGQIVRVNNRARHFLGGLTDPVPFDWPEEIRFLEAETLQPLDNSADPIKRALAGNTLRNETHLMRRLQGDDDQRYVRVESARPEQEDSAIHTVLVIDDISTEERNRQVVERKNRLDALGQLTGGIAHDFNNLLASLVYSVDLARRAKTDQRREEQLDAAMGSLVRGRTLTSRLLAFARKQPGLASVRKTSEIFDEFQLLVRPMLEAQIEIAVSVDDPALSQYCDPTQLETALMNLTLNARDAILRSGKGNRIDIRARAVRAPHRELDRQQSSPETETGAETADGSSFRYVEISVMDNGPGMDDETLARCTDPFFTTKDSNSGTGLGLAMVYGFIRQSDGDLRIYSEEGVGTTVQMTLPRGSELGGREEPVEEEEAVHGSAQTIFVVEDELPLLVGLTQVLEELDYQIISARSGPEAMEIAETGLSFDLLLTDVVMPGPFGGFELARRVREIHPQVPVLYTSGYTGFSAQEMGEVQAPLLQKPALPHELAGAIADALSPRVEP